MTAQIMAVKNEILEPGHEPKENRETKIDCGTFSREVT
jgi:hypothetical protein